MLDHDTILGYLGDAFAEKYDDRAVSLVSRLSDPALELPGGRVHLFIPDCHLISNRDAPSYPNWGFVQGEDLRLCLEALRQMKEESPRELRVWHLGDLFDIWRARGGQSQAQELNLITADHAEIVDLLRYGAPDGVKAYMIAGNHDYALFELAEWRAARFRIIENEDPDAGDIMVLHGDLFEWIERLPDDLQALAVRFATWHSSGRKDLYNDADTVTFANARLTRDDSPIGVGLAELTVDDGATGAPADAMNVIDGDGGDPKDENKKFFAAARELAVAMRARGYNIRLMVIGHTHWARIVRGSDEGGSPFVLLDAGAWIGKCRLSPTAPWVQSAQLGVVVGDELRIYQLGWNLG